MTKVELVKDKDNLWIIPSSTRNRNYIRIIKIFIDNIPLDKSLYHTEGPRAARIEADTTYPKRVFAGVENVPYASRTLQKPRTYNK